MFRQFSQLNRSEKALLLITLVFYAGLTVYSLHLPFFSDGIMQSSVAGQWFYDNGFAKFFIPAELSPGHPPFWGMYLAVCWKLFGQNLPVSHLAMLPFLLGIAWNYFFIARNFLKGSGLAFAMILLFLEPSLISFSTQVTPDIALLCFFLASLNALLHEKKGLQIAAMCLMPLMNTRGIMLVGVIWLMETGLRWYQKKNLKDLSHLKVYFPAIIVILGWLFLHYYVAGWIGFNREEMPWKESFQPVSITGYFRNWGILGWRFLDFGRVVIWLTAIWIGSHFLIKKITPSRELKLLMWFALSQVIIFGPVMTMYTGTLQHRYLLPAFLIFSLAVIFALQQIKSTAVRYVLFGFILLGLISGQRWIYPDKISQGWEASLAYIPYFSLRKEMINYIFAEGLDPNEIPTGSPNKFLLMDTDLEPANWKFPDHTEVEIKKFPYVIYSNVSNDFEDEKYDLLHQQWELVKEFHDSGVAFRLFRNPAIQ